MVHVVLFKFRDKKSIEVVDKLIPEIYTKLRDEFKVIDGFEHKVNCLEKEVNMDIILFVHLSDKSNLDSYLNHPEHVILLEKLKELGLSSKAVIDFI